MAIGIAARMTRVEKYFV